MYKTQLQELCQKKQWFLPKYAAAKVGPDHDPRFCASVFVNGVSFNTPVSFRSSKEAHNQAARIAFLHYSDLSAPSSFATSSSHSSSPSNPPNVKDEVNEHLVVGDTSQPKDVELQNHFSLPTSSDHQDTRLQFMYKNQLQAFAQRRNWSLPEYGCVREGPSHALRFKASVTVDGQTYEGFEFSRTLKEAEHLAARVALEALSQGGQEEEFVLYKNLLQDFCLKECLSAPMYCTKSTGLSHLPDFTSKVEVAGETFYGKPAKTKKQAEILAAKIAWSHLKERQHNMQQTFDSQVCQVQEALEQISLGSMSVVTIDLGQNHELIPNIVPILKPETYNGDEKGVKSSEKLLCKMQQDYHLSAPATQEFDDNRTNTRRQHEAFENIYAQLQAPFSAYPNKDSGLSEGSFMDEKTSEKMKSHHSLLCNRILVYSRASNVKLPVGASPLPIDDDKWIAVSLKYPNHAVS